MRVLLLATKTNLEYREDEIQNVIRSGLQVVPRLGNVSYRDIVSEITSGQYDVLWILGHGNKAGIELSDGIVAYSMLAPLVASRFWLVVLNTCESIYAAQALQSSTSADLVTTIGEVDDREAYQFGSLFAKNLVMHNDPRTAYVQSKPVDGKQLYISSLVERGRMNSDMVELSRALIELTQAVYKLDARMGAIEKIVERTGDHENRIIKLESKPYPNLTVVATTAAGAGVMIAEVLRLILK